MLSKSPRATKKNDAEDELIKSTTTPKAYKIPKEIKQLESKKIKFMQFTEGDKRSVIEKFLRSQEVLFLTYGLMFPS